MGFEVSGCCGVGGCCDMGGCCVVSVTCSVGGYYSVAVCWKCVVWVVGCVCGCEFWLWVWVIIWDGYCLDELGMRYY